MGVAWETVKCERSGKVCKDEWALGDYLSLTIYVCPDCSAHVTARNGRFSEHYRTPPLDEPSNPVGD